LIAVFAVPHLPPAGIDLREYLEDRFVNTARTFAALRFWCRGHQQQPLAVRKALNYFIPANMGADVQLTVWLMGGLMIAYTVSGGTRRWPS
jgi:hypothetical protein